MRSLLTGLAVLSLLLPLGCATPVPQADKQAAPTAASIEQLLRDRLAILVALLPNRTMPAVRPPSLAAYRKAKLLDFKLVELDSVTSSRWIAKIEAEFDFGPPPPAVLGFERTRRGRFDLLLKQKGTRLTLLRFTPLARLYPLPARH